ncbi:MBL fold metallo-hydrolase [Lacihabitans sp. LS3-19]|uniref:MBL fold metallo-hydrolase n=1 Tax=Lacihabitans sp. LS3-19 TaxID=2487335 RepID=UPI0020CC47A2|nr:MBL fold metallo-hydrolase [Lacihabitans sp. LS3-19]MCP9769613.1 MBL fold metallo-hydrolase [Lacihabitans sp. LS3-19]
MIKAFQKGRALIEDIKNFESSEGFKVWWLGQSGFLLKFKGETILFDPYLSDSLSVKYQNTDKPHVRMSELVIGPIFLENINIVTSSHNHTDHLDADTLNPIFENNSDIKFIIPEANRAFVVDRLKCAVDYPIGMDDGKNIKIGNFEIIGLPAAHNSLDKDVSGQCKFMSFVVKFGDFVVYHSGDTLWYDGLEERLKSFNLDLAFLPINGNRPERKVAGNLSFQEAAELGKIAQIKCVVPHHYHLFEFNTEDPKNFENACKKIGTPHKILELGQGFEVNPIKN